MDLAKLRNPFLLLALLLSVAAATAGQPANPELIIDAKNPVSFDPATGIAVATNGVTIRYGDTVMTADQATLNQNSSDIFGEGGVRILKDNQSFVGERLHYNYETQLIDGQEFRTGRSPIFAAGDSLAGTQTNNVYTATNGFITTDDYFNPLIKIRAKTLKIVPNEYFEAHEATFYLNGVPVFYFPYYHRSLKRHPNNWSFIPGYRSIFGPYLLSSYNWVLNEQVGGSVHLDWRDRRGFGAGPDVHYDYGQLGSGTLKYYYLHDESPGINSNGANIPDNRQRLYFSYDAPLRTNLTVKSQVAYLGDPNITRDFFETEYRRDIQPKTFVEVNQLWQNWSLDALLQPRVNGFYETVERLPDIKLSGFRQQILETPLFYESESSVGYYRHLYSDTNIFEPNYAATRADTYHQITLPENFFGWLNVTPRVGERLDYYGAASGPGATTTEQYRDIFSTGMEISTKASRVWPGLNNAFLDLDGLRHIIEPSINYAYIPKPGVQPSQLPQFDGQLSNSFYLQPLEFPENNAIDTINSENVIRYGLRNRWQTKRDGQIDDLVNWNLQMDWLLRHSPSQTTFSDIYSDLSLKPRSWLTLRSQVRYNIDTSDFDLARHSVTFQPNNTWSWTLGHFYLQQGPIFGLGNNTITSTLFYRLNNNWGLRTDHHFDAQSGTMQEQSYSIYRDLRSWTGAVTFRLRDNQSQGKDYTIGVTFSLKAFPRFGVGQDTVNSAALLGY